MYSLNTGCHRCPPPLPEIKDLMWNFRFSINPLSPIPTPKLIALHPFALASRLHRSIFLFVPLFILRGCCSLIVSQNTQVISTILNHIWLEVFSKNLKLILRVWIHMKNLKGTNKDERWEQMPNVHTMDKYYVSSCHLAIQTSSVSATKL